MRLRVNTELDYTLNKDGSTVSGRSRERNTRLLSRESEEQLRHRLQERTREKNRGMERSFGFGASVPDGGSHQRAEFRGGGFEAHHATQQDQRHFFTEM